MLLPLLMQLEMLGPKTGTGGIDVDGRKKYTFKPTGLTDRPEVRPRLKAKQTLADVQQQKNEDGSARLDDAALSVPKVELRSAEILATLNSAEMRSEEVSAEIGRLLKLKLRNDTEEIVMLLLLASDV